MQFRCFCVFGILFALSSQLAAKEAMRIDIRELPKVSHGLIGQRITTHGCLTVARPHGEFISPCDSKDWHELVLAYEADGVITSLPTSVAFGVIEGDFTGVLEELPITWPKPGKRVFMRIEKIMNAKRHEP